MVGPQKPKELSQHDLLELSVLDRLKLGLPLTEEQIGSMMLLNLLDISKETNIVNIFGVISRGEEPIFGNPDQE